MGYTVKISGEGIQYLADYSCANCGYADDDRSFFYKVKGSLYCSLHKDLA